MCYEKSPVKYKNRTLFSFFPIHIGSWLMQLSANAGYSKLGEGAGFYIVVAI